MLFPERVCMDSLASARRLIYQRTRFGRLNGAVSFPGPPVKYRFGCGRARRMVSLGYKEQILLCAAPK